MPRERTQEELYRDWFHSNGKGFTGGGAILVDPPIYKEKKRREEKVNLVRQERNNSMPDYMQDFGESMEQINKLSDLFKKTLEPMIPGETVGERAASANVMAGLGIGGGAALSAFAPQLWAILMGAGPAVDKMKPMATRALHGMAKNPNAMGYSKRIGHGTSRLPIEQGIVDVNKLKAYEAKVSSQFINAWKAHERAGAGRWADALFTPGAHRSLYMGK